MTDLHRTYALLVPLLMLGCTDALVTEDTSDVSSSTSTTGTATDGSTGGTSDEEDTSSSADGSSGSPEDVDVEFETEILLNNGGVLVWTRRANEPSDDLCAPEVLGACTLYDCPAGGGGLQNADPIDVGTLELEMQEPISLSLDPDYAPLFDYADASGLFDPGQSLGVVFSGQDALGIEPMNATLHAPATITVADSPLDGERPTRISAAEDFVVDWVPSEDHTSLRLWFSSESPEGELRSLECEFDASGSPARVPATTMSQLYRGAVHFTPSAVTEEDAIGGNMRVLLRGKTDMGLAALELTD